MKTTRSNIVTAGMTMVASAGFALPLFAAPVESPAPVSLQLNVPVALLVDAFVSRKTV